MTRTDLIARLVRLEQLSLGVAREIGLMAKGDDPMLLAERQEYLRAMRAALSGIETARVTLAKATHRLIEE